MTGTTPTTTVEALDLVKEELRERPEWFAERIVASNVALDDSRARETARGWWVPLGEGTARFPTPVFGDEAYIVVTRDGSSHGWYLSTSKPLWWDDKPTRSWMDRLLRRS
ncbi:hypothetical protein [Promicromonospora sp. NFX87]|uniref:hypothetical protein n=1 Tax=Promicromonospora sp. NFX87 TaxID=3402691 RepID=UPI003AFB70E9